MPSLIAKSPLAGHAPLTLAGVTLSEIVLDRMTSVAPFNGQKKAFAAALKALGLGFPLPNRFTASGSARLVWTGRDQAFLIGTAPDSLATAAALTDQSDGWACLALTGPASLAVLARLIALDLRPARFAPGSAARTALNHMSAIVMRVDAQRFELLVFRSMAQTAWHEITAAIQSVAARAAFTTT
ncbi:MAG: sarcosine oxidase subunit gamma family protein [Pseudorhodobacter sp.]|nr:sarcosine oxidase subunit gamma family protein [Pseudorhodobacter sp.]